MSEEFDIIQHNKSDDLASSSCDNSRSTPVKSFLRKIVNYKTVALLLSGLSVLVGYGFIRYSSRVLDDWDFGFWRIQDSLTVPEDMKDWSLRDKVQMMKDSFDHNWGEYNKQVLVELEKTAVGHTNYRSTSSIWLNLDDIVDTGAQCTLSSSLSKDRFGDVVQGVLEISLVRQDSEPLVLKYDIYQIMNDEYSDVYINIANEWYHTIIEDNQESFLNITPDDCYTWFSRDISLAAPQSDKISLSSEVLDSIYPYNLFQTEYCASSAINDDALYIYDGKVFTVRRNSDTLNVNFSELSKRADSALLHLLNSYYVATGGTLHRFTGYGTIGEIIVPSEVLSAKELDDKAKEILSTHVVQFVTDSMQRFKEVASNEKN